MLLNKSQKSLTAAKHFQGVIASRGIAMGPAINLGDEQISYSRYTCADPEKEILRLQTAVKQAQDQISHIREKVLVECGEGEANVFDAHLLILEDEVLLEKAEASIRAGINGEAAWMDAIGYYARVIAALADETLAARAMDVEDVGQQVLRRYLGIQRSPTFHFGQSAIVVARDLTPSETAEMDKSLILGLCTAEGSPTSHTAILVKALNIPAMVGMGPAVLDIQSNTPLILDAEMGELIAWPDQNFLKSAQTRIDQLQHAAEKELALCHGPAITLEGRRVEVAANIGSREDALKGIENGAEGVGLLRTEFIYLNRNDQPNEAEQEAIYAAIFDVMGEMPIVVRTLDIGGDKEVPYLGIAQETNPFLGWRAIRFCLDNPDLFRSQLRALLRASPGHDLRIMFPMIATLDELRTAKRHYLEVQKELEEAHVTIAKRIQLGIMVEIPSVAIMADQFAREVEFFSIGTNDLTQYTFAADRCNEKVASLGDPCHPAVLRLIQKVVDAAHQAGIWAGLCGEFAGGQEGVPILLGLGLDELSMAPAIIPQAKSIIRTWKSEDAQRMVEVALDLENAQQVRELVRKTITQIIDTPKN